MTVGAIAGGEVGAPSLDRYFQGQALSAARQYVQSVHIRFGPHSGSLNLLEAGVAVATAPDMAMMAGCWRIVTAASSARPVLEASSRLRRQDGSWYVVGSTNLILTGAGAAARCEGAV